MKFIISYFTLLAVFSIQVFAKVDTINSNFKEVSKVIASKKIEIEGSPSYVLLRLCDLLSVNQMNIISIELNYKPIDEEFCIRAKNKDVKITLNKDDNVLEAMFSILTIKQWHIKEVIDKKIIINCWTKAQEIKE